MGFNTDVLHSLFFLVHSNDTYMVDTEWKQSVFFLDKHKLLHYPANINFIVMLPEDAHFISPYIISRGERKGLWSFDFKDDKSL